jgi:hypothetical protein
MIRTNVKNAIQQTLQSTPGVVSVQTFRPKNTLPQQMPEVVIALASSKEERFTASAPIGKKLIKFTARLEIFNVDLSPNGSGQLDFDDLLDNIDIQLRKDPTLGGAVLSATIEHITTTVSPPMLANGQTVALAAMKTFDVTVQVTG